MNTLIVFVRYPEAGRVKTRIARDLGARYASELYSLIAEGVIERVSGSDKYGTVIFYDPPDSENRVRLWLGRDDLTYEPQSGVTIGDRMSDAFDRVFSSGAEKVVLIGTDIPDITEKTVTEAFGLLEYGDAVIGPAEDGGYYLLGLRKPEPLLFKDIEWGSENVFEQTISSLGMLNLSYNRLATLKDIDTAQDIAPEILRRLTADSKVRKTT